LIEDRVMRKFALIFAAASLLTMPQFASAQEGTAAGVATGAVTGAIVGGPVGAVVGAGVGGIAGGLAEQNARMQAAPRNCRCP
jgi:outer membrane lipoprotein SlyB